MGPNNTPEQQQNKESNQAKMEQLAQQAMIETINQILASDASPQEQEQQLKTLAAEQISKLKQSRETIVTIEQQEKRGELTNKQKDNLKEAKKNLHQALIRTTTLADRDVTVVENEKAQAILKELAKKHISESEAVVIQETIGDWILGEKEIVFGKKGGEKSDFQKALNRMKSENEEAYRKTEDSMIGTATNLGMREEEMREIFEEPKAMTEEEFFREHPEERQFLIDSQEYYQRFTEDQKKFLHNFYTPENFLYYVEKKINDYSTDDAKQREIKKNLLESFKNIGKEPPSEEALNKFINQQVKINVSQEISNTLSDIINQLYRQLQIDRPQKFFEEVEREDFLHGIEPIRNKINTLITTLQTNLETLESSKDNDTKNMYDITLVKQEEEPYTILERDKGGKMQPYLRVKPLPYFADVNLSKFVQSLSLNLNHWRHRGEYLHNARAIFSQPAGKEGFYENLGNYAEKLSSTDLDEIMMLPDGNIVFQAFVLYDKFLDEEFASQDWRHRTNQFTNQLERVNTKLEDQIIDHLMELYPDAPEVRIRNAVNVAVGMSRGVFLNEPEKSAYADPTDVEGKGHPASYSTNDAASLDVFNPLHTIMRWGGEHHWNLIYFMPIEGKKGIWNHNDLWKNMDLYYNSFLKGRGELGNLGQKKLFVDEIIDFSNVGGPSKRRGWRMLSTLEGHFIYDKDGTVNYPETFKAMDMIGYEAINDFLNNRVEKDFLSATAKNKDHPEWYKEKNDWFKYMYERYFEPLGEKTDFAQYMSDLRKLGEEEALRQFKETKPAFKDWEEFVELTTSKMFIERALIREVAVRFPTKFLRMDRDRFHKDGIGSWRKVFDIVKAEKGWDRDHFNDVMKDLVTAEMLLRNDISGKIKQGLSLDKSLGLKNFSHLSFELNEGTIKELLSEKNISKERVDEVLFVYNKIKNNFLKSSYLDGDAIKQRNEYSFTFGLEDTDFTLMAFRGGGPRIVPRAIKDVGIMEREVMPWIDKMPHILNDLAINGKHDFSPIIEYLRKAQEAYNNVHGTGGSLDEMYGFTYRIAGAVINYFKKDTIAKPLFGLFGAGRTNSIAGKYAGRSSAVWEWDSRDIDRFCVALESYHLIPRNPWDLSKPPTTDKFHNVFIKLPFFKHPIKTPFKKRNVDFEYNAAKLRKDHGADFWAISAEWINTILPIIGIFLLYEYIKKSLEEAEGKKK